MKHANKPNTWVSMPDFATTQLTYMLQLNPAPLIVSIPGEDPTYASLEFVIINSTDSVINVTSVSFMLQVGTSSNCITPNTASIQTAVTDTILWQVSGPGTITSGNAIYELVPATGSYVSLAASDYVVVQLYDVQTNNTPGISTVTVKEMIASTPGINSFQVNTFPIGFYFNSLSATVESGSNLVPVAQVNTGNTVTLIWNSSVVDTSAFTIYYSNASLGQQTVTPSDVGEWVSPPLSSDTVFTVVVTASVAGGQPLTASLSTTVSVQNPNLIVNQLSFAGSGWGLSSSNNDNNSQFTINNAQNGVAYLKMDELGNVTLNCNNDVPSVNNYFGLTTGSGGSLFLDSFGNFTLTVQDPSGLGGVGSIKINPKGLMTLNASNGLNLWAGFGSIVIDQYGNITLTCASAKNIALTGDVTVSQTVTILGNVSAGQGPSLRLGNYGALNVDAVGTPGGRFTVQDNGYVGINNATPQFVLDVGSSNAGYTSKNFLYSSGNGVKNIPFGQGVNGSVSINADGNIKAPAFDTGSDKRIKEVIGKSDPVSDLETLRQIEIVDYHHRDKIQHGNRALKKVIGQQVEMVYPTAVKQIVCCVPDIFKVAESISYDQDTKELTITLNNHGLKEGERFKFISDNNQKIVKTRSVTQNNFTIELDQKPEQVFIYGREVEDFRTVDYDAIAMLNVSATQALLNKIEKLETEQKDILKRIEKLEIIN